MKKILLYLPFMLFLAGAFISCEEVEEEGKYDNWRERNEAYIDSIAKVANQRFVATGAQADAIGADGTTFAILVQSASTTSSLEYVYCKKLVANPEGIRPNYVGYNSTVSTYYYGTYINGESFDGNFTGYTATDKNIPLTVANQLQPTAFDSPSEFTVSGVISGWATALQYMRSGERWMLYIPYKAGYGTSDSGSIPGYSALVFDVILDEVIEGDRGTYDVEDE